MQLRGQYRRDGVGRPKFDFHTDGTMLMFGFVCAARMTRRPIRPNPLIPTRIDMVFFCGLRVDGVSCGCAVFGGGGASGEILFVKGRHAISARCSVVHRGAAPLKKRRPQRVCASAHTRPRSLWQLQPCTSQRVIATLRHGAGSTARCRPNSSQRYFATRDAHG